MKLDRFGLKDTHGESADGVVRLDACTILVLDRDTGITPRDVRHDCVEQKPGIVFGEEGGRFAENESIESARVVHKFILFGESIERLVLRGMSSLEKSPRSAEPT